MAATGKAFADHWAWAAMSKDTAAGGTNAFVIVGAVFIGLAVLGCCLSIPIAFVFGAALLSG